jgi:hypothetical protein
MNRGRDAYGVGLDLGLPAGSLAPTASEDGLAHGRTKCHTSVQFHWEPPEELWTRDVCSISCASLGTKTSAAVNRRKHPAWRAINDFAKHSEFRF